MLDTKLWYLLMIFDIPPQSKKTLILLTLININKQFLKKESFYN